MSMHYVRECFRSQFCILVFLYYHPVAITYPFSLSLSLSLSINIMKKTPYNEQCLVLLLFMPFSHVISLLQYFILLLRNSGMILLFLRLYFGFRTSV